jgi:iron complex outermembrane receptor protein
VPPIEQRVEVVAITPLPSSIAPRDAVPANVQVIDHAAGADIASALDEGAAGMHRSDAQGGAFQPDVMFRGFSGSPLLGASEGLAVYQDGVRINERFGDTISWDAVPSEAIARITVVPGSSPLFGLNALGGAIAIETRTGFDVAQQALELTAGSFGRKQLSGSAGGARGSMGFFVAGALLDESGWRDHSPSTIRRLFGDVTRRGASSTISAKVTITSNDLIGNGAAPASLLDDDWSAVFTHPDRTDNDVVAASMTFRRPLDRGFVFEAVSHYRDTRIGTFNADALDDDDDAGHSSFDAVNNISRTHGRAYGASAQFARAGEWRGRNNYFTAGAGLDASSTNFEFEAELARLTPDRTTIGSGQFDDDDAVDVSARLVSGSAFISNIRSLSSRVSLSVAARVNHTRLRLRDRIGTALNGDHHFTSIHPDAGLTYAAAMGLTVYGHFSQSSRVPTPVELTCADPADPCRLPNAFVSDPPLQQIVATTWETGVRRLAGRATFSAAAYATTSRDDVIFVSSGRARGEGHFTNVDRTNRAGIEASALLRRGDRLSLSVAYTLQRATFGSDLRVASRFHPLARDLEIAVEDGDRLPGVPAHVAKAALGVSPRSGTRIGVSVRGQSGLFARGDEGNLLAPIGGFWTAGADLHQRLTQRIDLTARVSNIFDRRYATFAVLGHAGADEDPVWLSPAAPRAAWAGLRVRF